jgi:hypothetical protein
VERVGRDYEIGGVILGRVAWLRCNLWIWEEHWVGVLVVYYKL